MVSLLLSLVLALPVNAGVTAPIQDILLPEAALVAQPNYLNDPQNRISPDFKVPPSLEKRVGFWFDIYTKFSASQHVIHHADYPWIIYDVIDVRPIFEGKGHKWSKHHKAQNELRKRRQLVVARLQTLARKKKLAKLSPELIRLRDLLAEIPGKPARVARIAAQSVRSQLGQKDFIATGLINASRYFHFMEDIFEEHGLPSELTRLPLVESSFNEEAVSKVGASGIWQLMPAMGRTFLKMHGPLDERNSPLKATGAAARILKQNYKILKAWPLALTAYNHGPGGVRKATKVLRTNDLSVLIKHYNGPEFGFATSNFYCEFLAALHAEKYQREIFGDLPENGRVALSSVKLPHAYKVRTLLKLTGITLDDLQLLNPELRDDDIRSHTTLPRGYEIYMTPTMAENLQNMWTVRQTRRPSKKNLTSRLPEEPAG
ncbi:MAG: lytic transglycosylase domain-containing protein [Bdellovibrionia bacterium]